MKLYVQGRGELDLNQCDFVARGGEGAIYVQGDRAFKVYNDPAHVIPATKIKELSALTQPAIVRPQEILLDGKNRPVGYTMRRVTNGSPLCQLFTRAFRERKGVTPDTVAHLVRKLRDGVQFIHERNILIVDLNEMNLLVDLTAREVLFIDVDSYQTPGFPATAIMESVRDRHTVGFTQGSDWFAFGIVSFQPLHRHPSLQGKTPRPARSGRADAEQCERTEPDGEDAAGMLSVRRDSRSLSGLVSRRVRAGRAERAAGGFAGHQAGARRLFRRRPARARSR